MSTPLVVARLVPKLLGINGSIANAEILATTFTHTGQAAVVIDVNGVFDAGISPDVVCVGSGSTSALGPALSALIPLTPALLGWATDGVAFIAVGMGWDLLGQAITAATGEVLPGVGLFPSTADHRPGRFAGEVAGRDYRGRSTAGYINQVGTTIRHRGDALVTISHRVGPIMSEEGIVDGHLFGTRLGGPVLSLNPHLRDDIADIVLARRGLGSLAEQTAPGFAEFHARTTDLASRAREGIFDRLR